MGERANFCINNCGDVRSLQPLRATRRALLAVRTRSARTRKIAEGDDLEAHAVRKASDGDVDVWGYNRVRECWANP
jgi:hypothetical protein